MTSLPNDGYLRLKQIIGDPKATPPIHPIFPIGKSTWWAGIQSGRYPKGVKLSPRTTAWRCEDIRQLLHELGANGVHSSPLLESEIDSCLGDRIKLRATTCESNAGGSTHE
jgi:predicted DNA-binding transcriptional regulator AlpA